MGDGEGVGQGLSTARRPFCLMRRSRISAEVRILLTTTALPTVQEPGIRINPGERTPRLGRVLTIGGGGEIGPDHQPIFLVALVDERWRILILYFGYELFQHLPVWYSLLYQNLVEAYRAECKTDQTKAGLKVCRQRRTLALKSAFTLVLFRV